MRNNSRKDDRMKASAEPVYGHGGDVYKNTGVRWDFSININPLGMPDFIKKAAIAGVEKSGRYPDSRCLCLKRLAAGFYEIPEERILFGNGAAELIFGVVNAVRPGRAVLLSPTFSEYEEALKNTGTELFFFCLKEENGFLLPVGEYLEFLQKIRPDMIFLCNPANPSGGLVPGNEIREILGFCKENGIFAVVDECFLELAREGEEDSALPLVRDGEDHIFLLKAFTKSFAMAGLRLGYSFLADGELKNRILAGRQPWSVSIPAQEAGEAAFGAEREAYLSQARELIRRERRYLEDGLKELGFGVFPSEANFLLFRESGQMAEKTAPEGGLYQALLSRGILIRSCENYRGLSGAFYRICVKKREENRILLENLGNIYKDR